MKLGKLFFSAKESDFSEAIWPVLTLGRLLAVNPGYRKGRKTISLLFVLHCLGSLVVVTILAGLYFPKEIERTIQLYNNGDIIDINSFIVIFWLSCSFYIGVINITLPLRKSSLHHAVLQTLRQIDRKLNRSKVSDSLRYTKRVCAGSTVIMIIQICSVVLFETLEPTGEMYNTDIGLFIASIWCMITAATTNLWCFNLSHLVQQRISILNQTLEDLIHAEVNNTQSANSSKNKIVLRKELNMPNIEDEGVKVAFAIRRTFAARLKLLSVAKGISKMLGDFFLLDVCSTTLTVTTNLAVIAQVFYGATRAPTGYLLGDFFTWTGTQILGTVLNLLIAETVLKSDDRSRALAMELLLKTRDRSTRQELRPLISQMHHGKIFFTACGVFRMDCTVIKSMVAAVITYLCILMQFMPMREDTLHAYHEREMNGFKHELGRV